MCCEQNKEFNPKLRLAGYGFGVAGTNRLQAGFGHAFAYAYAYAAGIIVEDNQQSISAFHIRKTHEYSNKFITGEK